MNSTLPSLPDAIAAHPSRMKPSFTRDADEAMTWLRHEITDAAATIPLPGGGNTVARWRYLAGVGRADLVHCRLIEGHLDALAILDEMHRPDVMDTAGPLAVWAASPRGVTARCDGHTWRLTGAKPYCTGSTAVHGALVTATAADGPRLFALSPDNIAGLEVRAGSWPSVGMAASASHTLGFELDLPRDAAIGAAGGYTNRRGFWAGGGGVAAGWLGGAYGLIDRLADQKLLDRDASSHRSMGKIHARLDSVAALARETARSIDDHTVATEGIRRIVLGLRVATADAARAALAVDLEFAGTGLHCSNLRHSFQAADLGAYLTQLTPTVAIDYEIHRIAGVML